MKIHDHDPFFSGVCALMQPDLLEHHNSMETGEQPVGIKIGRRSLMATGRLAKTIRTRSSAVQCSGKLLCIFGVNLL